jgi:hypothetical protein
MFFPLELENFSLLHIEIQFNLDHAPFLSLPSSTDTSTSIPSAMPTFTNTRHPQKRAYAKPRPTDVVDEPVKRSLIDEKAKKAKLLQKQKRREERKGAVEVVDDEDEDAGEASGVEEEAEDDDDELELGSGESDDEQQDDLDLEDQDSQASNSHSDQEDAQSQTSNPLEPSTSTDPVELENVTFESLGMIPELVRACTTLSFTKPTPIQAKSIPPALEGNDIIGLAQTGSGKTAAFLIPILQSLFTSSNPTPFYALVLAPTRELAYQIDQTLKGLGSGIGVRSSVLVGGMDMMQQSVSLGKRPHVIVATPGRLMDHLENTKGFSLRGLKYLVRPSIFPPASLFSSLANSPNSPFSSPRPYRFRMTGNGRSR